MDGHSTFRSEPDLSPKAQIFQRNAGVGVKLDRPPMALLRAIEVALRLEDITKAFVYVAGMPAKLDRLPTALLCAIEVAHELEDATETIVGVGNLR